MNQKIVEAAIAAIVIGIGATAVMDLWALFQRRILKTPTLDFRMVGRWIGHFPRGQFTHNGIGKAQPVAGEAALGWSAHYLIGIVFAAALILIWGMDWVREPTLIPALIVGIGSVVAPFFLMQPAFGLGIAASKSPKPWLARARSLATHTFFALGLYLSAWFVAWMLREWRF